MRQPFQRAYDPLVAAAAPLAGVASPHDRLAPLIDLLWESLRTTGVSWVGFYLVDQDAPPERRLVLGPSRDTPACSPIGLGGVCGAAYTEGIGQIVRDVTELGEAYVACDPRDRSELVTPIFHPPPPPEGFPPETLPPGRALRETEAAPRCWAVLDLDAHHVGAFGQADAAGLVRVLDAVGLRPARRWVWRPDA